MHRVHVITVGLSDRDCPRESSAQFKLVCGQSCVHRPTVITGFCRIFAISTKKRFALSVPYKVICGQP